MLFLNFLEAFLKLKETVNINWLNNLGPLYIILFIEETWTYFICICVKNILCIIFAIKQVIHDDQVYSLKNIAVMIFLWTVLLFCIHRYKAMHLTPTITTPPVYTLAPHTHIQLRTSKTWPFPPLDDTGKQTPGGNEGLLSEVELTGIDGKWLLKGAFTDTSYLPVMHSRENCDSDLRDVLLETWHFPLL